MKIMTLGAGFVADHLPYEKITERIQVDWHDTRFILSKYRPDVLVNCLGKTGRPNVDWCESHKIETAEANVTIPIMLAELCAKLDIRMIQLGSGCIYFGASPNTSYGMYCGPDPTYKHHSIDQGWQETDFANPQSFYSKTKYSCDLILGQMPHVTTLRLRMPVSDKDTSRNLINKLRGYKQVINIPNSMTFMSDLAPCIDWVAKNNIRGTYHVVNPQPITATQIMKEFQKYVPEHRFEVITERQLDDMTVAKRSNCILNTDKLRLAGFQMTDSETALHDCMASYIKNMRSKNV